jgi:hypothetical protein
MKNILSKLGTFFVVLTFLGLVIDTGGFPSDNTLVYLHPQKPIYYPPTRTPANQGYIPTSYYLARKMGAKPDDPQGFTVDGPPLLIYFIQSFGYLSSWPNYWYGTNTALESFKSK